MSINILSTNNQFIQTKSSIYNENNTENNVFMTVINNKISNQLQSEFDKNKTKNNKKSKKNTKINSQNEEVLKTYENQHADLYSYIDMNIVNDKYINKENVEETKYPIDDFILKSIINKNDKSIKKKKEKEETFYENQRKDKEKKSKTDDLNRYYSLNKEIFNMKNLYMNDKHLLIRRLIKNEIQKRNNFKKKENEFRNVINKENIENENIRKEIIKVINQEQTYLNLVYMKELEFERKKDKEEEKKEGNVRLVSNSNSIDINNYIVNINSNDNKLNDIEINSKKNLNLYKPYRVKQILRIKEAEKNGENVLNNELSSKFIKGLSQNSSFIYDKKIRTKINKAYVSRGYCKDQVNFQILKTENMKLYKNLRMALPNLFIQ